MSTGINNQNTSHSWFNSLEESLSTLKSSIKEKFNTIAQVFKKNIIDKNENPHTPCEEFYVPGRTVLLTAPIDFISQLINYIRARSSGDKEAQNEALIRLSILPAGFTYAAISTATAIFQILSFFNLSQAVNPYKALASLTGLINVIGIILSTVELAFELLELNKDIKFLSNLGWFKNDKDSIKTTFEQLHKKYLTLSEKEQATLKKLSKQGNGASKKIDELTTKWMKAKQSALAHQIHPWAAKLLMEKLTDPLDLDDPSSLEKAQTLMNTIKIQNHKKTIAHLFGITALISCMVSLICILAGAPWIIPIGLFVLYCICYLTRYLITKGTLNQEGWNFSFADCIPAFLKKAYSKISINGQY